MHRLKTGALLQCSVLMGAACGDAGEAGWQALSDYGAAIGLHDRVELSLARQDFDTRSNLAPLGLDGLHLKQDIVGLKLRLAGDAVLDSDTVMPQIAVGVESKRSDTGNLGPTLYGALGARRSGNDLYVSATKLFLAEGLLVNLTLRSTQANQNGLLGFGGVQGAGRRCQPEISVAKLLRRDLAVGVEFRAKPDNLNRSVLGDGALKENAWFDVFVAWAPSKQVSLTAAYVDLGRIAPAVQPRRQTAGLRPSRFQLGEHRLRPRHRRRRHARQPRDGAVGIGEGGIDELGGAKVEHASFVTPDLFRGPP